MRRLLLLFLAVVLASTGAKAGFTDEATMKADLLQMLANFATYMQNDFQDCVEPNSVNETCGCFRGEHTMANDERGVRPNADLSMICAFLVKYGKNSPVNLPNGVTWESLEQMAMKSLVFAYSTHKANRLKVCAGGNYWGSTSAADHTWESSLWAMSVAYSAFFQWDKLSEAQKGYIYQLLKAECNYELERSIPTGYDGDTKAEENGWETDVLAVTLGLFPNDPLAPQWFQRLREFAINSYSQKDDAFDETVVDPDYDQQTVKDLYKGQNLYDDYTLQNHDYFHTSYQNVVIQELGEAALALKLFQKELYGEEKWKTNALMHNNDKVMREVLYWLALSDGELAMPNGNDWSLFLYDQITSYSTNACFLRDPHALLLENKAYQMIKARQQTTADGSWLLRPDVGARRMGVEAHRVMMTWLMHEVLSTYNLQPSTWEDFRKEYSAAKVFASQNIVRASTPDRFTCFSWSNGLKSYTGYIAPHITSPLSSHYSNLIVPFRQNNMGNFLGWYEVEGKRTNATPVVSDRTQLMGDAYTMNGELQTNDGALNHRFAIYSTPGNAVIYLDNVRANDNVTINHEKGGLMALSVDDFTSTQRNFHTAEGTKQLDGTELTTLSGNWVNVDNQLGIVTTGDKQIAFGEKANNNSIMTAKLYTSYSDKPRNVKVGDLVDSRSVVYYSNIDAATTARLSRLTTHLSTPDGWKGIIVFDPDSTAYLLLSNFTGDRHCRLTNVNTPFGAPVFDVPTTVGAKGSSADFEAEQNSSVAQVIRSFTKNEHTQMQDTLREVVVKSQATRRHINDVQIGAEKIDVETMSQLPAMLGERDIIKSLQLLPGVKMEGDGLGGYQVRGGTSAQNQILLDGASVYNVGHLMGLFSSFNDDAMGGVDLYKGLVPARYGGGSSSVLNISTRSGNPEQHHFSTTVGLLSAKAEADGPMGKNGSTYLVAGRTSYVNLFIKGMPDYSSNSLRFYDLNARLNFRLGDADQLSLALFHSYDKIDVEKMLRMAWSNSAVSLGWLHTRSTGSFAHTQLVASDYDNNQGMDVYSFNVNMEGYNRQLTLRHQQTWTPNAMHTVNAGGETTLQGLQSADWRLMANYEREKRDTWLSALWLSDDMAFFNDRLLFSMGLRCEWISPLGGKPYYNLDDNGSITETFHPKKWSVVKTYTYLQPRVNLTWKVSPTLALKAGYSKLTQSVQPVRTSSMTLPIDRMAFTSNNIKPQVADQLAAGFSMVTADGAWDFSADGYWKKLKNVYDFREGKVFNTDIEIEQLITGGRGRAYGAELSAHKNKGLITGWAAYTLSWVQNKIDGIMDGKWYTASNDRRHDFVIVLLSQLTPRWTLSSTWRYTTGQAMTAPTGKYEVSGETHYYYGKRNQNRAPAYHRLDLSAAYSTTKGKATRIWTFGIYNAYNRYNPFFISFKEDDTKPSGTKAVVTTIFGFVPTVSFTYKY